MTLAAGTPRVVSLDATPARPWRNGGGVTRELLTLPDPAAWQVRVSVAEVARDGPFSSFAGVTRWFCVLEGDGVALTVDGVAHRLLPGSPPLAFDGGARVDCRLLGGATRDLNLMLHGRDGSLQRTEAGVPLRAGSGAAGVFALAPGRLDVAGGASLVVAARSLVWFDEAPAALVYHYDAQRDNAAWWIAVAAPGAPNRAP